MTKRTTVYLEESEVETLKKISFMQSVSMAELIRNGVQNICSSFSKEDQVALSTLSKIRDEARASGIAPKAAMREALRLQKEVRHKRKTRRR